MHRPGEGLKQKLKQEIFNLEMHGKFTELETRLSILFNTERFESISLYMQKHPMFLHDLIDALAYDDPSLNYFLRYSNSLDPLTTYSTLSHLLNTYHPNLYTVLKIGCFMKIEDLISVSYYSNVYGSLEDYTSSVYNNCNEYFPYSTTMDYNIEQYMEQQEKVLSEKLETMLFTPLLTLQKSGVFTSLQQELEKTINITNFSSIRSYNQQHSHFIDITLSDIMINEHHMEGQYMEISYLRTMPYPSAEKFSIYQNTLLATYHPKLYALSKAACFTQLEIAPSYHHYKSDIQPALLERIESFAVAKCHKVFPYQSTLDESIDAYTSQMLCPENGISAQNISPINDWEL